MYCMYGFITYETSTLASGSYLLYATSTVEQVGDTHGKPSEIGGKNSQYGNELRRDL